MLRFRVCSIHGFYRPRFRLAVPPQLEEALTHVHPLSALEPTKQSDGWLRLLDEMWRRCMLLPRFGPFMRHRLLCVSHVAHVFMDFMQNERVFCSRSAGR